MKCLILTLQQLPKQLLNEKLSIAQKNAYCNYSFFVGAAKENIENLKNLERLPGCCGVKIFMGSSTGDLLVEDDDSLRKILASGIEELLFIVKMNID